MTSKTSFFPEVREMLHRRHWPLALCLLTLSLYFGLGVFFSVSSVQNQYADIPVEGSTLLASKVAAASDILGGGSPVAFFVCILAVVLSMQGFAWLHNRREIDFFESQPVSRSKRFAAVYVSSVLIFVLSYAIALLIGLLAALGMQSLTTELLLEALYTFLRCFILYLGMFSVAALAMMLTGNIIIALLANGFLLAYEFFMRLLLTGYSAALFPLVASEDAFSYPKLSPICWYIVGTDKYPGTTVGSYKGTLSLIELKGWIAAAAPADVKGLLLAIAVTILAFCAYRVRKNESAGTAVVFRPVRIAVKIMTAVLISLAAALLTIEILGGTRTKTFAAAILMMALAVVVISGIMEIIYTYNFKAAFRHIPEMAAGILISLGIFGFYAMDPAGINRYVPELSELQSVAMYPRYNLTSDQMDADGLSSQKESDWFADRMQLPDPEAALELARTGMQYTMDHNYVRSNVYDVNGYNMQIVYTLKNGKRVSRVFSLPGDVNASLMDRIVGSREYQNAMYQLSEDEMSFHPGDTWTVSLSYQSNTSDYKDIRLDREALARLREAYLKDLEMYNFTFAHDHYVDGQIHLEYQDSEYTEGTNWDQQHQADLYIEVYPEYENTIAVLKELGVYRKNQPELADIAYAQVVSYSKEGDQELKELGISEALVADDIDLNPVNGAEEQNTQTENQTSGDEKQSQDITNQDEPYADQSSEGIGATDINEDKIGLDGSDLDMNADQGSINIKITDPSEIQKLLERAVSEDYDGRYHTGDQFVSASLYVTTREQAAHANAGDAAGTYAYRIVK